MEVKEGGKMQAVVLTKDFKLEMQQKEIKRPSATQVLVHLSASALNRRDYWITQKLYPRVKVPTILGSDGCGKVVEIGEKVEKKWLGATVVMNPTSGWKGESPAMHELEVLGMPKEGTLAEYVLVDVSRIYEKPSHLSDAEGASLPLAGVTAFRAVFKQGLAKRGSAVFVSGIGSGVSTFAAQFASAIGCRVVVSSSSQEKLDRAISRHSLLGGVLYSSPAKEWSTQALELIGRDGFDLVIDGAAGRDFNELLRLLKPGGRFVSFGGTSGKPLDLDIFRVFLLQLKILGTSMGSDDDFAHMIKFVEDHRIIPVIGEVYPWEDAIKAINDMAKSNSRGKIVISAPKCKL